MGLAEDGSGLLVNVVELPVAGSGIHVAKVALLRWFGCLRGGVSLSHLLKAFLESGKDGGSLEVWSLFELPVPNADSLITTAEQRGK